MKVGGGVLIFIVLYKQLDGTRVICKKILSCLIFWSACYKEFAMLFKVNEFDAVDS